VKFMKILICATEYYPYGSGIANVAYNVVEQLKKTGVDCVVCSPTGPDIKLGTQRPFGILGLLFYWYKVATHFKKFNTHEFDAVWLHNPLFLKESPFNNCLVTMNSTFRGQAISKNLPFHLHIYKKFSSVFEKYSLTSFKSNIRFTGVGNNVCKELEEIGLKKERIKYIPNGVDVKLFKPSTQKKEIRNKFNIPEKNLVLLSVGRLNEVKQPLKLIEVFSLICNNLKNISLVIAGDGELFEESINFANKLQLDNIIFLGAVDHKIDLPELYSCADSYIITSRYEGGEPPLTLSEAMACGLPCIASNIPNFKIIEISNSGIVVDFSDTNKSAEEILNFIQKDNSECSINARKYVVQNLDWGIISDNYLNEFSKIVK
jgi:1,2-diacylglycerol 3-alpha-glucosyltransferase